MKKSRFVLVLVMTALILIFSSCSSEVGFFSGERDLAEETEENDRPDEDDSDIESEENEPEEDKSEENESERDGSGEDESGGDEEFPDEPDPESIAPSESENIASEEPAPADGSEESGDIRPISMSEAGMEPIPISDLNRLTYNPIISELTREPWNWDDEHYALGIDQYNYIFVALPRFPGGLVGSVGIGVEFSDIIDELGDPGYARDDMIVYRTESFYLAFFGAGKAELAAFVDAPVKDYDDEFLYDLIAELNSEGFTSLEESIEKIDPDMDFFHEKGSNDGTTYFAHSVFGINVSDEKEPIIDILNNYEGNLYMQDTGDIRFSQAFIDLDAVVLMMRDVLLVFDDIERCLGENGVLSPDGRLVAAHYPEEGFIIRTLDNSIEDRTVYARTNGEFRWLDSRYLLYIKETFDLLQPYIVDVDGSTLWGEKLFEMVGLDRSGNYRIVGVENKVITLEDTGGGETIEIAYEFNGSGEISLSVQ